VVSGLKAEKTTFFVSRLKVFDEEIGTGVEKIWIARVGFKPVLSSAAGGNVPSVLKFNAEAKINVPGTSDPL
jgi:hypothetical protein